MMDSDTDFLVQWDRDGTKNVVSVKDITVSGPGPIKVGSSVCMSWNGIPWTGKVLETTDECGSDDDEDDEDDIPLATLKHRNDLNGM